MATATQDTYAGTTAAEWRVHTYWLLREIVETGGQPILQKPLSILANLLAQVGERAAELDDPRLNALMLRLTIYTAADPDSPDYNPELVSCVMREARQTTTQEA